MPKEQWAAQKKVAAAAKYSTLTVTKVDILLMVYLCIV